MLDKSVVSIWYTGRHGNQILEIYRAFWFAVVHDIPISNVILHHGTAYRDCPIFNNIATHFVGDAEYYNTKFDHTYNAWRKPTAVQRRELFDFKLNNGENIRIGESMFLYPERPWELALFNHLFDNRLLRHSLSVKYAAQLSGNSVGFVIRRGDMVSLKNYRTLTNDDIINSFDDIIRQHGSMVKIIVSTDDIPYVEWLLKHRADISDHVFVLHENPAELLVTLSLCDRVINNGQYQTSSSYVDMPFPTLETTFGQISQLLNKSYKYASLLSIHDGRVSFDESLSGDFNTMISDSAHGGEFKYPTHVLNCG